MHLEVSSNVEKKNIKELTSHEVNEISSLNNMRGLNIVSIIQKCFGCKYDTNAKYLISIQGSSSSGKSTLAHSIYKILMQSGIECLLLQLDGYYKTTENKIKGYDFDNPAALDWSKIRNVLKAVENGDQFLPLYEYSFVTKISVGPIMTRNNNPSVIIVEGIYAFNCINSKVFNIEEFDPTNSDKIIENEYIESKIKSQFKVLKVCLTLCKDKSLAVRIGRDVLQRNKTREEAIEQFNNQVWPATQKWVNSNQFEEDIRIIHGSFNENKAKLFVGSVSFYFTKKMIAFQNVGYDLDLRYLFCIKCSQECRGNMNSKIILEDENE